MINDINSRNKPNISVRGVIIQDEKILLVNGDGNGDFWCLPGGRMEYGENLKSCLVREVKEETGLDVTAGDAFAVSEFLFDANHFHNVDIFFHCTMTGGKITDDWVDDGGPVVDRKFYSLQALQTLNVFPRWLRDGRWLNSPATTIYHGQEKKN